LGNDRLRLAIGGAFLLLVWGLLLVRVILGVGPMHDYEGRQAPTAHYLAGALATTVAVALWITLQSLVRRKQRQES
jgi:hypothetical protein